MGSVPSPVEVSRGRQRTPRDRTTTKLGMHVYN
jgi:hypothetical protein